MSSRPQPSPNICSPRDAPRKKKTSKGQQKTLLRQKAKGPLFVLYVIIAAAFAFCRVFLLQTPCVFLFALELRPLRPPNKVRGRSPHTLCPCKNARVVPSASTLAFCPRQERGTPPPPRRWRCPRKLGAPCAPCPPRAAAPALCLSSCSAGQRAEQVRAMLGAAPSDRRPETAPLRGGDPLPPPWRPKR